MAAAWTPEAAGRHIVVGHTTTVYEISRLLAAAFPTASALGEVVVPEPNPFAVIDSRGLAPGFIDAPGPCVAEAPATVPLQGTR